MLGSQWCRMSPIDFTLLCEKLTDHGSSPMSLRHRRREVRRVRGWVRAGGRAHPREPRAGPQDRARRAARLHRVRRVLHQLEQDPHRAEERHRTEGN